MGRGSFGNAIFRTVFAVAFLSLAWLAIGPAISMGLFGEKSTGEVTGYWERQPPFPLAQFGQEEPVLEPRLRVDGRSPPMCKTIYRDYQPERNLPGRGMRIEVHYWRDALTTCYAASTIHAGWRLGLGGVLSVIGLTVAASAVSEFVR